MKTSHTHSSARLNRFALLLAGLLLLQVFAGCGSSGPDDENPVLVSVETAHAAAVPGENLTLVWRLRIAPDWHLYWTGRNDSGFAPTVDLKLPPGWIAGALQWPVPERHLSEGDILDHVYYEELVLLQQVGLPETAATGGEVTLSASVAWLACKDSCVPGRATVELTVPLAGQTGAGPSTAYERAKDDLPLPMPADLLTVGWEGAVCRITGPPGTELRFMPTVDCGELVNLIADGVGTELALRCLPKNGVVGPVRGLITVSGGGLPTHTYVVDHPAGLLEPEPAGG